MNNLNINEYEKEIIFLHHLNDAFVLFAYVRIVCIPATQRPGGFTRPFPDRQGTESLSLGRICNSRHDIL